MRAISGACASAQPALRATVRPPGSCRVHADAGVALRRLGEDRRRRVGRAVVDDDQLEVGERLRERRVERLAEEALAVPHRHDDADPGRHSPTSSANSARWRSTHGARSKRSTARARATPAVASRARAEHRSHGVGQRLRRRRHVLLPRRLRGDADPGVADELRRAAARRVDDRHAAGERLEHDVRARVVHLRVEEHVRAAVERRRVALRVAADEARRDRPSPQLADQLLAADDARRSRAAARPAAARASEARSPGDRAATGRRRAAAPARRPAARSAGVNSLVSTALCRTSHDPARRAEEVVGGLLAELALVDDVGGRVEHARVAGRSARSVSAPGPRRIGDAVLVDDDRRAATPSRARSRVCSSVGSELEPR